MESTTRKGMYGRRLNRLNRTLPSGQPNERRQISLHKFSFHTLPAIATFLRLCSDSALSCSD